MEKSQARKQECTLKVGLMIEDGSVYYKKSQGPTADPCYVNDAS
jgi:hypothetical protein